MYRNYIHASFFNVEKSYVLATHHLLLFLVISEADPSGRVVKGMGLRPHACWDCGFESRRGHECVSLASVVCS